MFNAKRTGGFAAAIISLAMMSLPVAMAGETDQAAGTNVENELVQTGTAHVPVQSSGETDSYSVDTTGQESNSDPIVSNNVGETDAWAGVNENELVQTGTLVVAVASSGETDQHGIEVNAEQPVREALVRNNAGETDAWAGVNENKLVQTGTLVLSVASSGETDAHGIEVNAEQPVRGALVYVDGMGETDQAADGDGPMSTQVKLTRTDIAGIGDTTSANNEILVFAEAGETDLSADTGSATTLISVGEIYALLRRSGPVSDAV